MIDVGDAARRLAGGWWAVVAGAVLGTLGGAGVLAVGGTPWVSCSVLEVEPVLAEPVSIDAPVRRFVVMDNELAVIESEDVRSVASQAAGFAVDGASLTASVPPNTEVLRFCYRDGSRVRAQVGAASVGEAYRRARSEAVERDVRTRVASASAELALLEADIAAVSSTDPPRELSERLDTVGRRLELLEAIDADGSRLLQEALPATPDARYRRLVLVPALGFGLLLGCAAALVRTSARWPRRRR